MVSHQEDNFELIENLTMKKETIIERNFYSDNDVNNVHMLTESQETNHLENELINANRICRDVIKKSKEDPSAYLTQESIAAFQCIRAYDQLEYERLRSALKTTNTHIRISSLDAFTKLKHEKGLKNQGTELAELAANLAELWHDNSLNAYATFGSINSGDTKEHWPIDSSGFREWLSLLAYKELGSVPSSESIKSACNTLAGLAKYKGEKHKPYSRVAVTEKGLWIDLCNDSWGAILVTENGWWLIDNVPIKFIRSKSMRALPTPISGGNINDLWSLVNVPKEDRILILAWILESLRENTPYPVAELSGEQGSAKSSTQKVLRHFIDPNEVALRAAPRKSDDLFIAAANGHLISLENLSSLSNEISDVLCTIATGGGSATRAHYTNKEESVITAKNPIILNGIGSIITRPDLLDRSVVVSLPTIKGRLTETELAAKLDALAPGIMGAILDLLVGTLANLPAIEINAEALPRMADFARLGEALGLHLGLPPLTFLHKYIQNRQDAIRRVIDSNPVATACIQYVTDFSSYNGTVKNLLDRLNQFMNSKCLEKGDYWPKSPRGLGDALRRVAPALRQMGIECSIESKPRRDGFHCSLKSALIDEDLMEVTL